MNTVKQAGPISQFLDKNYLHFNAKTVVEAAQSWKEQLEKGNLMLVTLAGAMSTAELGISLAEMIRQGKVHAISCTGANLEEDVFNLVAHDHYHRIANWRGLSTQDEVELANKGFKRVTDTCIPEDEAMRKIEKQLQARWKAADEAGESYFPYEYFYQILLSGDLKSEYQIDPKNSWLLAAAEKNLPIFTPGWEDSTCGNMFVAYVRSGEISNLSTVKSGLHCMSMLADWYIEQSKKCSIGFFQIGGGIAGDFPICVVPMIREDLQVADVKMWSYFCQISDSTTSYGSYSGAVPNEKITWHKIDATTPQFLIESDATIVAPLIFAYVLGN